MFETLEIRWFWQCDHVDAAIRWFLHEGQPHPEERTDRYLVLPGCETVGVKLRDNRFEIKALLAESDSRAPGSGPPGREQRWTKWSLDSARLPELAGDIAATGTWRAVTKQRFQRRLAGGGVGSGAGPTAEGEQAKGCNVELTRLGSPGGHAEWLTLAFEAYGPPAELQELLYPPVEAFWRGQGLPPEVRLTADHSTGYPGWLNRWWNP